MPPPVYSRVAIRIGFGRLPPAGAREGKDHDDADAHCARYQETRPAGAVACADIAASSRGSWDGRDSHADMEDCSPKPKADRGYGSKIDPYPHLVDEWLEADRMLPGKQRHTIGRVHDRLLADGPRRRVFDHDALRAPVARGEPRHAGSRGARAARVGGGRHAGRFRHGPGPDRGRDGGRALPGGLVAVFEHAVVCGVAG